jgi:trimethylamine--corrinoid protein Co-methyltransferase
MWDLWNPDSRVSLQLQVLANETIGFLRAATRGVVVNDETLALDVIDELGATGSYLQHPHTLAHYREPFYATLFDKGTYSQWQKMGGRTVEEKAARVVDEILEKHHVPPLNADIQEQIRAIVRREQEWSDTKK